MMRNDEDTATTPWAARALRLTTTRIIAQSFFFALFIFLLWSTWFSRLGGYPVSLFLELDPLVAAATALSTNTIYRWLWRSLWVLIPTLILGRVFCNWMCPYGTLHQFLSWVFNIRSSKESVKSNAYSDSQAFKYYVLVVTLVLSGFGLMQVGLLDPICLLTRTFAVAFAPAFDLTSHTLDAAMQGVGWDSDWASAIAFNPGAPEQRLFSGAWFVGGIMIVLLGMNLVKPRFFCRVLCPLGAMLGVLSRFSLWRIDRDLTKCTDCDLCLKSCQGACDPQAALRKSECFGCMNCIDDCPEDALSFRFLPVPTKKHIDREDGNVATLFGAPVISKKLSTERLGPDVSRRHWFFSTVAGVVMFPFWRFSNAINKRGFDAKAIRPPGAVAELEFLERCIKCDQCIHVCPTNVLQPATLSPVGLEGLWTPVMDFSVGFCQYNCTLCSEVCPTGAIQKISLAKKLGLAEHTDDGPIRLGTAFYDRGRCLPWAMETPCVVCEEVCPVAPKAIDTYDETIVLSDGSKIILNKPYIRPELCIGCGICEHECPVLDDAAVYVTAIGESRSTDRTLLLEQT